MSGKKNTIPTHNTTNKQDSIQTLLNQLEIQYNQHLYKYKQYKKSIWNQNPIEELSVYLKGLLKGVSISCESILHTEKSLQLENKKVPNKLILLKIHLMILKARIYLSISYSKPEKHAKAIKMFFSIMLECIKNSNIPYIKNSSHQKEMVYALRMISRYGDAKELPHYNVIAWSITRCAIEKQYNDGFDKLDAYGSITDFTQNTRLNTLNLRKEFYGIFEAMDKDFSNRFTNNALSYEDKLDYLNAIALIYEATVKNHPTVLRTTVNADKKAYSIEAITKFFTILQQEYEHFVPKLDALIKSLDLEELTGDLDDLGHYHHFISRFYKFTQSQLKDLLYTHTYLEQENTPILRNKIFDLIVKMRRFFIDFHAFNKAVDQTLQNASMNLCIFRDTVHDVDSTCFIIGNWLDEKELSDFIEAHSQSTKQSIQAQNLAIKASNETMQALISETNKSHPIRKKTQKPLIIQKTKTTNQNIKEKKNTHNLKQSTPLSESFRQCQQGALMLTNKNYEKAIFHFDLSYKKALTPEEKLHALDGLIYSHQQLTLCALMPSNSTDTDEIISNGINNLIALDTLYNHFKQLTLAIEKNTEKDKLANIMYGNSMLRDDYLKIKTKVNQLYMIKDKQMAEKNKPQPTGIQSNTPTYKTKMREMQLPQSLKEIFDFLNQVQGDHYLVGSMVLSLLQENHEKTIDPSDLDFLSLHAKSEDWIKNGHFMQVTEEKHLFKLTRWCPFQPFLPLEVWLEEKETLNECLLSRDFTVSALACSSKGIIYDPTGLGFEDLKNKRLRMIGQPETRFTQSPSILLRVIKYIQLGFTPDKAIIDAIHSWQPTKETNIAKLHALCEKIFLASPNPLHFAYHLKQSELLAKLFDFTDKATDEDVLLFLENKWGKTNSSNKNSFFQKQDSCADASCKAGNLYQL